MALSKRLLAVGLWLAGASLTPIAAAGQALHFGVIGDSGTGGSGQKQVAAQMVRVNAKEHWEFVLMLGDNIYENGNPADFDRKFKRIYRPLMEAGVKFHATLGNHDTIHRDSKNGMVQVADPAFGYVGGQDEYILEAGPEVGGRRLARFLTINSEAWIEAVQLKNEGELKYRSDRLKAWLEDSPRYRWNILFMHHPLYSYTKKPILGIISRGHGPEEDLREVLEPLLGGKVDIVLSGHEHFFQAIRPQHGVYYIISGGGGKVRKGAIRDNPQVEYAESALHFLDVSLDTDAFRYRAINDKGKIIYFAEITKPPACTEKNAARSYAPPSHGQTSRNGSALTKLFSLASSFNRLGPVQFQARSPTAAVAATRRAGGVRRNELKRDSICGAGRCKM